MMALLLNLARWFKRKRCGYFDHDWTDHHGTTTKRKCTKCHRVEWLMRRHFPMIGQPALFWQFMRYDYPRPQQGRE